VPTLPDLSIRQLEYLVAVADSATWAAAAGDLGVSPSALSQGLAELERRVGVPLFDREGRRRVFRPTAAPVLDHARQVVALTGDLARWSQRTRSAQTGQVRVGMIDAAAVNHLPGHLRGFRASHPDLQLRLKVQPSGALFEDLVSGDLDLVVAVEPDVTPPGVELTPLLTERLAIYRPDGGRAGPPERWGPWVLFPEGSHTRVVIADALRRAGAPIEVVAESHQPEVLREMVTMGLGWTVLPTAQAESGESPLRRAKVLTNRRLVIGLRSNTAIDPAVVSLAQAFQSRSKVQPIGSSPS
jgi:DNA-binding transcriptional LysR family regulator